MEIKRISPSFISTDGATDGQVLAYSATSGSIGFSEAGGGGGVTVYANVSVLPNTGISIGSEAYVESTDSLYIWTVNNAWQQISTVNTPPSALTNYLPIYYLASNGAATTISFISSDPEDVPLNWGYSIVSGVLGNTTITNSSNVFTITPSTNSVDEGLFTVGFFASDGLYSANANIQFNLSFVEGWNVSNATLIGTTNVVYKVTSQETNPHGLRFSADGGTMYVVGITGDDLNEYTLSAPYNIDSPTFVTQYPFTANNFINPRTIQLSPDGANLYVSGQSIDTTAATVITQFYLPTPNNFSVMNTDARNYRFGSTAQETVPTDVFFKDDGTRMYILGSTGDDITEYQLSLAWNPNTASSTTTSFSVSGKETTPTGMYFTPSGNSFYVVGTVNDSVHRYNMSTPWSVNSAVFASSFSVAAQEINPHAVEFKPDGTRMYVIGSTGDDFNEYSLSTPWDITTATFVRVQGQSPGVANAPSSMRFSNTGLNLYMTGTNFDVNYYTLSEAWNVATISFQYTWDPIWGNGAENVQGCYFNSTGEYFYIVGLTTQGVFTYHLRTPWDLTSAYLPDILVDRSIITGLINYFKIKPDGTKIYITGPTVNSILEYNLTIPWNIASSTYSNTFSIADDTLTASGIDISEDGTKIYIIDDSRVYTYYMSTPWELSSVYRPQTIALITTSSQDIFISPNGANAYVAQNSPAAIQQYTLSTPWNLHTVTSNSTFSTTGTSNSPRAVTFNNIGTKMFVAPGAYLIDEYALSTPWDVTTASYSRYYMFDQPNAAAGQATITMLKFSRDGHILYIGSVEDGAVEYLYAAYLSTAYDLTSLIKIVHTDYYNIDSTAATGMEFDENGDKMYLQIGTGGSVYSLDLSTPYDPSSVRIPARYSVSDILYPTSQLGDLGTPRGLQFSSNGAYAYTVSIGKVFGLTLTEPYNIYSAKHPYVTQLPPYVANDYYDLVIKDDVLFTINNTLDNVMRFPISNTASLLSVGSSNTAALIKDSYVSTVGPDIDAIVFKPDGTKLFVADGALNIFEYNLLTPWDLNSLSLQASFNITRPAGSSDTIAFSTDGRYLYSLGISTDTVYQYKLTEAWTLGPTLLIAEFSINSQETNPSSLAFSSDGVYMYVVGTTGDDINQYTLSTPWDISTATFTRTQSISAQDATPRDLVFKPDGTRLYVRGSTNSRVSEYALSTPWDVSSLTYTRQLQLPAAWSTTGGIALNYNGTRLYVGDSTYGFIREYIIGS